MCGISLMEHFSPLEWSPCVSGEVSLSVCSPFSDDRWQSRGRQRCQDVPYWNSPFSMINRPCRPALWHGIRGELSTDAHECCLPSYFVPTGQSGTFKAWCTRGLSSVCIPLCILHGKRIWSAKGWLKYCSWSFTLQHSSPFSSVTYIWPVAVCFSP